MALQEKVICYQNGATTHHGFFVSDDSATGPQPGVIVIHEWWGLNDYIQNRCRMLAELGYCAFAIDMYGGGKIADNPDDAGNEMQQVLSDMETGTERLRAGYQALLDQPEVDAARTAAMGYCFGGAMALHMARIGMPLRAAVSFHGALGSFHQATPGSIGANILVCHGGDDAMVSMEDLSNFKQEMEQAEAKYSVIVHEGAGHGFTSRDADTNGEKYGIPVGYNQHADNESWQAMQQLYQQVF